MIGRPLLCPVLRLPQPLELLRLRRFAPRDRVTTTLPGHRLVVPEPGAFLAQWNAIWERGHYAFSTTNPAPRILDCGANVGLASLYWKRTHPGARITAFEADPKIAAM